MQDYPDWASCINLRYPTQGPTHRNRYERAVHLEKKRERHDCAQALPQLSKHMLDNISEQHNMNYSTLVIETGTKISCTKMRTELPFNDNENIMTERKDREKETTCLRQENDNLRKELEGGKLTEDTFREKDEKALFYPRLSNWKTFFWLVSYICEHLKQSKILSPFQQLLFTLMRMRLNLPGEDLGFRFEVRVSTVSRTFTNALEILYLCLRPLIIWPDRETLKKTLPMDFRKYSPNCVVIIDCFDLFLERSAKL